MKNVQMDLDRMDKAMLAEIAARSRQLGVTTGIQCRANEQRKPDDNPLLMDKIKTRSYKSRAQDTREAGNELKKMKIPYSIEQGIWGLGGLGALGRLGT